MGKVYQTVCNRRTIRRFQKKTIPDHLLVQFINAARLAPSAGNIQPCEFIVIDNPKICNTIFPFFRWAAYIEPGGNPPKGERPVAYIIALINVQLKKKGGEEDVAAAIENIILSAWDEGVGCCWIHSIDRKQVKKQLRIPHHLNIHSVIALGYPNEQPVVDVPQNASIKYWKDDKGVIHVPKRPLEEILHRNKYGHNQMDAI